MKRLRASIVLPRIIQWISSPTFVSVLFASVLLATLTAGLWPFHAPGNDATLVQSDSAIRFSGEGTAISDGMLQFEGAARGPCTIELWLKPASAWKGGTPLDFYNRERQRDFAISQDGVDLLLRSIERSNRGTRSERVLVVRNVFRRREFLLTLASDTDKLIVYIDGQLVLDAPGFYLSSDDLAAQLIVGNASRRNHGWAGEVKGLAIYGAELSASEGMQHVRQWSAYGGPGILPAQSPVAVFRFRGSGERVVSNDVPGGPQLILPQKYQTVDQLRFESAISELHYDDSYWDDAILNVLGFAPLGCVAALVLVNVDEQRGSGFRGNPHRNNDKLRHRILPVVSPNSLFGHYRSNHKLARDFAGRRRVPGRHSAFGAKEMGRARWCPTRIVTFSMVTEP